jgi:hypothetical protein
MGWCTTSDPDRFAAAAGGYLRSRAAENSLLLSATGPFGWQPHRTGSQLAGEQPAERPAPRVPGSPPDAGPAAGPLFGWWEPPDGGEPRAAFVHDPARPLLISGRAPEMAATLAATLVKMGRAVNGVDAPTEAADAFAAAWSQRAGTAVRMHKHCRVYRLAAALPGEPAAGQAQPATQGRPATLEEPGARGRSAAAGRQPAPDQAPSPDQALAQGRSAVPWPSLETPGPAGRLRVATAQDLSLLTDWLAAFSAESLERIGSPRDMAADLIGYGGAVFWEAAPRPARRWDPVRSLPFPHRDSAHRDGAHRDGAHRDGAHRDGAHRDGAHRDGGRRDAGNGDATHRDAAQAPDPAPQPVALATLSRPVAGTVRIVALYTPPERRRHGYAAAVTIAVGRAVLSGVLVPGGAGTPGAPSGPAAGYPRASVREIVLITERNRPEHWGGLAGYQLVGERTVLRFGPATGPAPRLRATGPMPRMPTGPLPRLPRLRRSW